MFLLVLLVLAAVLAAMGDIPLTDHAKKSHAEQTWNFTTIAAYMDAGHCKPTTKTCDDVTFHYCRLDENPDLAIGLIVGATREVGITGFAADYKYWDNRCPAH